MDNLTVKTQEALQAAQTLASTQGHQALETPHIFLGAWQTDSVLVEHLFKMVGLNGQTLKQIAEAELSRIAKV
ncbi:MAG: Clp protease N-terminal domain-containing protein, partial [Schleiferiaceae bacterium]